MSYSCKRQIYSAKYEYDPNLLLKNKYLDKLLNNIQ